MCWRPRPWVCLVGRRLSRVHTVRSPEHFLMPGYPKAGSPPLSLSIVVRATWTPGSVPDGVGVDVPFSCLSSLSGSLDLNLRLRRLGHVFAFSAFGLPWSLFFTHLCLFLFLALAVCRCLSLFLPLSLPPSLPLLSNPPTLNLHLLSTPHALRTKSSFLIE